MSTSSYGETPSPSTEFGALLAPSPDPAPSGVDAESESEARTTSTSENDASNPSSPSTDSFASSASEASSHTIAMAPVPFGFAMGYVLSRYHLAPGFAFSKLAFTRLVREIIDEIKQDYETLADGRVSLQPYAVNLMQEAVEIFLLEFFDLCNEVAAKNGRRMIQRGDLLEVRGLFWERYGMRI
ncbi:hypothetical protein OQA88_6047 [Cercophora sp. LCS_1]